MLSFFGGLVVVALTVGIFYLIDELDEDAKKHNRRKK